MGAVLRKLKKNDSETFSLIWLDATVNNSQENINAQHQLRKSINHLKTFTDSDQCERYIRSVSVDDQIVLVVSGHLGQVIVPRIHRLRQISSIYVYCMDKAKNEQWSNQFEKVNYILSSHYEMESLPVSSHNSSFKLQKSSELKILF
jgi:hypothetical protein